MTLVKSIAFPNSPVISYEVDPEQWDTEKVEGATGESFRNGRRTTPLWYCRLTLQDKYSSDAIQDALDVKSAAQGQIYGFKFTCLADGVERDVAFKSDDWRLKIQSGVPIANALTTIDVELEEVIDGVAYP